MSDEWIFFKEIDFTDTKVKAFHIDTRDFHCITSEEGTKDISFSKIEKYPERFFYTPAEVVEILTRLFNESGGNVEWRYLSFEGEGAKHSEGWQCKYLRIHRHEKGLVIFNNQQYALNKEILKCKINEEYLNAH